MRVRESLIGKPLNRLIRRRSPLRIAITGTQASGKTVFLTSLLTHLKNHDPRLMSIGNGAEIVKCDFLDTKSTFTRFPYESHRAALQREKGNNWPSKTGDSSSITAEIIVKSERKKRIRKNIYRLEFLDFPGERSADFEMGFVNYAKWSDSVLNAILVNPDYTKLAEPYFQVLRNSASEKEIIKTYKLFLGNAFSKYYGRIITPSIFLLDQEGKRPDKNGSPESWGEDRLCGLDKEKEFVPLSEEVRETQPELAEKFESYYNEYVKKIVSPLVKWMQNADQLFMFIDVLEILEAGPTMYNDVQSIGENTLGLYDKTSRFWKNVVKIVGGLFVWPSEIKRIGIVTTKTDLVATSDDIDNMETLVRDMTYITLRGLGGRKKGPKNDFFTCSAVKSTERAEPGKIRGRVVLDSDGKPFPRDQAPFREFSVSQVPNAWPKSDKWKGYSFPEVYPKVSPRRDAPPEQEGLGAIIKFMLNRGD